MIGRHLTEEQRAAVIEHLRAGRSASEVREITGCALVTIRRIRNSLGLAPHPHGINRHHRRAAMAESATPPAVPGAEGPAVPLTPRERRDADFWRARHDAERKARLDAEHLAEHLAGVRATPVQVPEWIMDARRGGGRSVVGGLVSDVHMGEVIAPEEIEGINAFNVEIARARLKRYFGALVEVGARWASDTTCEGAFLALAGDLVSGDIHDELRVTNALTAHEQVAAVVEDLEAGIRLLLRAFGRVHVVGVPGNHGRTTPKPTAKLAARLSYDMLAVQWLAQRFPGVDAVTWQFSAARDQTVPILGRTAFVTHGDAMGTKGGMGFAGPNLPIVRGGHKVLLQQSSVGRRPDLILCGHYHTSSNPSGILANGSVPGYSEFGATLRAAVEPPQMWAFLLHSRWWLRERASIQLEEPAPPTKPRVSVPARMAAA